MSTDLLATLDILGLDELAGFDGSNEHFALPGEVTKYVAGEWVETVESIQVGDREITLPVRTRLLNPRLTSFASRLTNASTYQGRFDFNGTVVTTKELHVSMGDQWIPVQDLCVSALRKANPGLKLSDQEILSSLRNYGLMFDADMPMFIQHLGASPEAFQHIAEQFVAAGAHENQINAQGTKSIVQHSYRHEEGLPIVSLDLSKADRTRSARGTGFIGFLDATWNTFRKVAEIDRERAAIRKALEADPQNTDLAKRSMEIKAIFTNAATLRAFRNHGGTTMLVSELDPRIVNWYAQQVPCGRFQVSVNGETHTWSVWGPSARGGSPVAEVTSSEVPPQTDTAATF